MDGQRLADDDGTDGRTEDDDGDQTDSTGRTIFILYLCIYVYVNLIIYIYIYIYICILFVLLIDNVLVMCW